MTPVSRLLDTQSPTTKPAPSYMEWAETRPTVVRRWVMRVTAPWHDEPVEYASVFVRPFKAKWKEGGIDAP